MGAGQVVALTPGRARGKNTPMDALRMGCAALALVTLAGVARADEDDDDPRAARKSPGAAAATAHKPASKPLVKAEEPKKLEPAPIKKEEPIKKVERRPAPLEVAV